MSDDTRHVDEAELLAYVQGEAVDRTVAHLSTCPACAEQAAAYMALEHGLRGRLFRVDCPPTQILGELVLGLLSAAKTPCVQSHLLHCGHCRSEVRQLREELDDDPFISDLEA